LERKALLIVGDGMADRSIRELNGKTPLEYAYTPNMDRLAREGVCGLRSPLEPGLAAESDVANLALLGFDPMKNYLGRGVFEALGLGIKLKEGELAFRVNLATIKDGIIVDRRAGRFNWDKDEIVEALNRIEVKGAEFSFYPGVEHRGVLIVRGKRLSKWITGNDPHRTGVPPLGIRPRRNGEDELRTSKLISEFLEKAHKTLSKLEINERRIKQGLLPANFLLIRGPGVYREIEKFEERYGIKGCVVCGFPMVRGVCVAVGLDPIYVEGAIGGINTNYIGKAEAVVKCLKSYDFIYLHFKAPDTASHEGDYEGKVRVIERIDEAIGRIIDSISLDEVVISITADHATPISVRDHTGDLVPFLLYSSEIVKDDVKAFSERWAYKGGWHRIGARDLVNILLNYAVKPSFVEF